MAKKKAVAVEKRNHTVVAKAIHLFGIEFSDNQLRAFMAFGRTPQEAAQAARNTIQRHLPRDRWDTTVEYVNPEAFEKLGVSLDSDGA